MVHAGGAAIALLTQEAKASLVRLARRIAAAQGAAAQGAECSFTAPPLPWWERGSAGFHLGTRERTLSGGSEASHGTTPRTGVRNAAGGSTSIFLPAPLHRRILTSWQ